MEDQVSERETLLGRLEPATADNLDTRLRFGLLCVTRVAHLLEDPGIISALGRFKALVEAPGPKDGLAALEAEVAQMANRHPGSKSLDGVGHAAVSASYACAKAMAGRARQAADYAAYAMVYGQGGYGATSDPESFAAEHDWQAAQLCALLERAGAGGNGGWPGP
jgi:hypothetical protein